MTPNDISTILSRLGSIEAKLDGQGEALSEIRTEVKKTNGRVTALESKEKIDRALIDQQEQREKKHRDQLARWVAPLVIGFLVVVASAATVAVLNIDKL